MTDTASLILKVDSSGARKATDDLDKLTSRSKTAEKATADLMRQAKRAGVAIGTLAAGAITLAIKNTIEQERVTRQLEARLKSTGGAAGLTKKELLDMASGLQAVTTYGDEAVIEAENLLLTFTKIGRDVFPKALETVLDMSTAMDQGLKESSIQLGKALNDPIQGVTALTRVGVQFTDEQKETIKKLVETGKVAEAQRIILKELETQMGGSARAARDTLGGAIAGLKNAFGDLLEGDSGSDGVRGATAAINELTETLNDPAVKDGFQTMVTGALTATQALAKLVSTAAGVAKWFGEELASRVSGTAIGDTVRIEQRIERLKKTAEGVQALKDDGLLGIPKFFNSSELTAKDFISRPDTVLARLQQEIKKEQDKLRMSQELSASASALSGVEAPALGDKPTDKPTGTGGGSATKQITEQQKAADALSRAYESYGDNLHRANELFGKQTSLAQLNYEIQYGALKGISAEQSAVLREQAEWLDWQQEMADVAQGTADAAAEHAQVMADRTEKATDQMTEFARQAARNIQDAFSDFLFDPFEDGLSGMLRNFADTLKRMAAEAVASNLFNSIGQWGESNSGSSGWAGFFASIAKGFGGGRAGGGPVMAGQSYLVGDGGKPEIFTPGQNGRISQVGGGVGPMQVQINNYGSNKVSTREERMKGAGGMDIRKMVIDIIADDMSAGGRTGAALKGRYGLREAV
ncbi:hypothetical protein CSC70_06320 [Pseudoxanthomonas kalamensis DSM 18571]|uniref:phage tail length tape measure family protein n=1 Tax=Pseudoxanthomonas kalamensis TaxID=289483 RepID=UPI001390D363|nr:phage tail length tape measure family protein [Pseudoxanthomonas kalamensis]KAF1710305.1 hypothetical protein CSC70_06320 [Pseudoxanthomonas kalamensis DSM 18571]